MEDTRLPKCVMFGELVGARAAWGSGKRVDRVLPGRPQSFGINADKWTTAAQDERELRKTAEQGAERFVEKWRAAERARTGLRHAVIFPNVTEEPRKG